MQVKPVGTDNPAAANFWDNVDNAGWTSEGHFTIPAGGFYPWMGFDNVDYCIRVIAYNAAGQQTVSDHVVATASQDRPYESDFTITDVHVQAVRNTVDVVVSWSTTKSDDTVTWGVQWKQVAAGDDINSEEFWVGAGYAGGAWGFIGGGNIP